MQKYKDKNDFEKLKDSYLNLSLENSNKFNFKKFLNLTCNTNQDQYMT